MIEYTSVKDSGERQQFSTGSVRDTQTGKGRFDLISPIVMKRFAQHMENGAVKYEPRNWEKGQPLGRYFDSANRHLQNFLEGDTSEDHLAAAMWNIHCLMHTQEMIRRGKLPESLDDLPDFGDPEKNAPPAKDPRKVVAVFEGAINTYCKWFAYADGSVEFRQPNGTTERSAMTLKTLRANPNVREVIARGD